MAQRQFRTDDTDPWVDRYGAGGAGPLTVSGDSSQSVANAGCSGTASTTSLTLDAASTFANGNLVLIHQTRGGNAGVWELNKISSGGGGTSLTMAYNLLQTYVDSGADQAQILELKEYGDITINTAVTYSCPGWNGSKGGILALLSNGTITVTGTASAKGATANDVDPGGFLQPLVGGGFQGGITSDGTNSMGGQGESTAGAGTQSSSANASGGGGGGGNANYNAGGGGGHATAGANATGSDSTNGTGGSTISDQANLTSMTFGGAGGGATGTAGASPITTGTNGGGIVILIGKNITVTGAIDVRGGSYSANNWRIAGGAGAGGAILIKGQNVTLGTTLATAIGGTTSGDADEQSGDGGNGRIHCDYSQTLSGTTTPTLDSSLDAVLNDLPSIENYTLLM